jgi:hypothetical protein
MDKIQHDENGNVKRHAVVDSVGAQLDEVLAVCAQLTKRAADNELDAFAVCMAHDVGDGMLTEVTMCGSLPGQIDLTGAMLVTVAQTWFESLPGDVSPIDRLLGLAGLVKFMTIIQQLPGVNEAAMDKMFNKIAEASSDAIQAQELKSCKPGGHA